ncbi:MAG: hypothetical protein ACR2H0_07665 [Candidatus Limnocylindrales bacterium]
MIVLRALHIGFGVLWVGAAWMMYLFVEPTLKALGSDVQKKFMGHIVGVRRLTQIITGATVVTVGAGAILYVLAVLRFTPQVFFGTGFGIVLTIGAISAIIAFLSGLIFIEPGFSRLAKIGAEIDAAGGPPKPEQVAEVGAIGARLDQVFRVDFVLLVIAVLGMAIARYV